MSTIKNDEESNRYSSKGEALYKREYETQNGSFRYSYYDERGKVRSIFARTLTELREREKKILAGEIKPIVPRRTSDGRYLNKGESELKPGRYQYCYRDDKGKIRYMYAGTLDELREIENDDEKRNRPEKTNTTRLSSSGEILNKGEYQHKERQYYYGRYLTPDNKKVSVKASTLEMLREKRKLVEEGCWEGRKNSLSQNCEKALSSKGETLNKGERETKDRYRCECKDSAGRRRRISARTLEELRIKAKNIDDIPFRTIKERKSSKGEVLNKGEYEVNDGYRCKCVDSAGKKRHPHAQTLEELRLRVSHIDDITYSSMKERKSSKGEVLNKGEYEVNNGYKGKCVDSLGRERQLYAKTLEELRLRVSHIDDIPFRSMTDRKSSKGEVLNKFERETKNGYRYECIDSVGRIRSISARTLEELRIKASNIDDIPYHTRKERRSSKGEDLNKGEYEVKNGYKGVCYDSAGRKRRLQAKTLEELRIKASNIDDIPFHPIKERKSSKGEVLYEGEYETKKGYTCKCIDSTGRKRYLQAQTLEELRIRASKIDDPVIKERKSSKGEVLNKGERQLPSGRYAYEYIKGDGKRSVTSALSLEKLRIKEKNILEGHPEKNRERYSPKGELLLNGEFVGRNGKYTYRVHVNGKKTEVHAQTLKELRKKVKNIKAGHPERNYYTKSSKGELLVRGEHQSKHDGRYYYYYKEGEEIRKVSALTLEELRGKEQNIMEGHPENNRIRISSRGEILEVGECEDRTRSGYRGFFWDPVNNKWVRTHALTLEILRERKERIKQGLPALEIFPRVTIYGEVLEKGESYVAAEKKYRYTYKIESENRWKTFYADTLEELRWMKQNVVDGHPEWNRPNYTKDGQRLRRNEEQLMDGKVVYTVNVGGEECAFVAPTLDSLREIKSTYLKGLNRIEEREGQVTLYEYFNLIFQERKDELKFSTYTNYINIANRYLRDSALGNTYLQDVTRHQIKDFISNIAKEISANRPCYTGISTANCVHGLISQLFDYALDDGLVDRDPSRKAKLKEPINTSRKRRALTEDEQERFREQIKGEYFEPHILFLLETGVRFSELIGLRWSDIDYGLKEIGIRRNLINLTFEGELFTYIDTPKTQASVRTIPLTRNICRILEMVKERCDRCAFMVDGISDFVFTNQEGVLLNTQKMRNVLNKYIKKANRNKNEDDSDIPFFSCHCLRHTFATNAARIGVPPIVTKALMGHSMIETTMDIYQECHPEMLQAGSEMLCLYYERRYKTSMGQGGPEKQEKSEINTTSAIVTLIETARKYGASYDQILVDLKNTFGMEDNIAIDVLNGFWITKTKAAVGM